MGLINGAWLPDGSYLSVILAANIGGPTDRRAWALIEDVGGKRSNWECLDIDRQFTSMPEVRALGTKVIIDALSTPPAGEAVDEMADFWVPWRNVYIHDTSKSFLKRFSGWQQLGPIGSRARPTLPPLP